MISELEECIDKEKWGLEMDIDVFCLYVMPLTLTINCAWLQFTSLNVREGLSSL